MKLYTRTGDQGQTSIIGGRVLKDDIRVEAYGTIDELNSDVGMAICFVDDACESMKEQLLQIQHELFDCGSDLAKAKRDPATDKVNDAMVVRLEEWIDQYDQEAEPITRFILPGGTTLASMLHRCRTVCRRAERRAVTLAKSAEINETVIRYLNRLSDLFFVMARAVNARNNVQDVTYVRSAEVFRRSEQDGT